MNRFVQRILLSGLIIAASGLPVQAASLSKTYSYFSIGGRTLEELEKELTKRGPKMKNSGKRHPGATQIEFTSKVGYAEAANGCSISRATVTAKVKVILPRWKARRGADGDTRLIWDTLSADIKRHEESHVIIAKNHARELEDSLRALHRFKSCDAAQNEVKRVTQKVLSKHDREQERFDKIEGMNFESRILRLLKYRLERLERM